MPPLLSRRVKPSWCKYAPFVLRCALVRLIWSRFLEAKCIMLRSSLLPLQGESRVAARAGTCVSTGGICGLASLC
jgi:hypothetical protein